MTEPLDRAEGAALWRRWRAAETGPARAAAPPPVAANDRGEDDREGGGESAEMLLAAFVESRLGEDERDRVEAWLAERPELVDDIIAARGDSALPEAPAGIVDRATALVAGVGQQADSRIVPFRRRTVRAARWRIAVAWGGLAASIAATSLVGFELGSDTYASLIPSGGGSEFGQELLDPPTGFFNGLGDEASS